MSKHAIEVSFTPLCSSCGEELACLMSQSDNRLITGIFERDNPSERKDQRVFVEACKNCYQFIGGKS